MIELIQMLGLEIKNSTINKIKEATYFSIIQFILDCTLDTNHKRTNVYWLRCVCILANPVKIKEYFFRILESQWYFWESLFNKPIDAIKVLKLSLMMYKDMNIIIVLIWKEKTRVTIKDY